MRNVSLGWLRTIWDHSRRVLLAGAAQHSNERVVDERWQFQFANLTVINRLTLILIVVVIIIIVDMHLGKSGVQDFARIVTSVVARIKEWFRAGLVIDAAGNDGVRLIGKQSLRESGIALLLLVTDIAESLLDDSVLLMMMIVNGRNLGDPLGGRTLRESGFAYHPMVIVEARVVRSSHNVRQMRTLSGMNAALVEDLRRLFLVTALSADLMIGLVGRLIVAVDGSPLIQHVRSLVAALRYVEGREAEALVVLLGAPVGLLFVDDLRLAAPRIVPVVHAVAVALTSLGVEGVHVVLRALEARKVNALVLIRRETEVTAAGVVAQKLLPVRLILGGFYLVLNRAAAEIEKARRGASYVLGVDGKIGSQRLIELEYLLGLEEVARKGGKIGVRGLLRHVLVRQTVATCCRGGFVVGVVKRVLKPVGSLRRARLMGVNRRLVIARRRIVRRDARAALETAHALEGRTGTRIS